jgi:hypothetical protein
LLQNGSCILGRVLIRSGSSASMFDVCLSPQQRHKSGHGWRSEKGQQETHALQQGDSGRTPARTSLAAKLSADRALTWAGFQPVVTSTTAKKLPATGRSAAAPPGPGGRQTPRRYSGCERVLV